MSVLRHTAVVSTSTAFSRILGVVREIAMANMFGVSLAKSAFDVAFKIPNLFRALFGEGALSAAFVPVYAEVLEHEGRAAANRFSGKVMGLLALWLTMITSGTIVVLTLSLRYIDEGTRTAAVLTLLRIMFPFMIFICLVALCMGILNAIGHFATPALTPIILNLLWIGSVIWVCPRFGETSMERIHGVAWAVLLAGIVQLAVQIPVLLKHNALPRLSLHHRDPRLHRVLILLGPAAAGMGVHQINVMIDGFLALWAGDWAPAALTYAVRLTYLPLGVFTTAMATVLLPTFSRKSALGESKAIPSILARSLTTLMMVILPAAAGMIVLRTPLVQLMFQSGRFDNQATLLTARALAFYAPGLVAFSLTKILVPCFYALQDTRTPVKIAMLCVALNFVLNVIFVVSFPTYYKHAGLALATVFASCMNGTLLAILITRRIGSPGWKGLLKSAIKASLCCLIMVLASRGTLHWTQGVPLFSTATKGGQALTVLVAIAIGIATYASLSFYICRKEWKTVFENADIHKPTSPS